MADFTKCRSGSNFREGSAVTVQPVIVAPSGKILSVTHGNDDKNWSGYFAIIAPRWQNIGYYYNTPA